MVRMTLAAPTPGAFWAKAHGLIFMGKTTNSVFAQIDAFEEAYDLRASSYFVYDFTETPFYAVEPCHVIAYANNAETAEFIGWKGFPEHTVGDPSQPAIVHDSQSGLFAYMAVGKPA